MAERMQASTGLPPAPKADVSPAADQPPSPEEIAALFAATYEELRRLARLVRGGDADQTLNPTALVNEAYLKLGESLRLRPASRQHFKRLVARAMRQVLVESARRRRAVKRGGGALMVTLDEGRSGPARSEEVLALDAALRRLARTAPRQAQMIEYRFFGGYGVRETAELLGVSEPTVIREWRASRAWLSLELRRSL
jgi:RNA polymerase sigma-70 factor, ECF subfamily